MLCRLDIRDFVLVDHLALEFDKGFTVLTGETGAGKSIMIDALALVLGERADAGLVRQGCDKAEVSAEFLLAEEAAAQRFLEDNDLAEEGQCLLRRVIDVSGRSRAWINGRPVTVQQLRTLGDTLVDIHGQHEHQSLSKPQSQRDLLDAYAGAMDLGRHVARAWAEWQAAKRLRISAEGDAESIAREREQLEWEVSELDRLAFREDEWRDLCSEQRRLAHATNLVEAAEFALQVLSEADSAALASVSTVQSKLLALVDYDSRLREILETLDVAQIQLQETIYGLRHYQQGLEVDPQRLTEVNERLGAIHSLSRKHRTQPEELPALLERSRQRLDELAISLDAEVLQRREKEAKDVCLNAAAELTLARSKAARQLSRKVTDVMQNLAMQGGAFNVELIRNDECTSYGLEQVEFRVAGHAGTASRPLSKVASGGELSRIALAIETVTTEVAQVPTLIFDEVDSGIGGGAAEIVGHMLKTLGSRHQVMCVTHLPQVAASAAQQWRVSKQLHNGHAASSIERLSDRERIEEIARMLGGVKITELTRKHAAELLASQ
ncbi:MAG: DNA repair protein RecN [Burkholderiales bacterium]|nr:DNA repair protein RecN [Burkholderiales bacterium]